MSIVAYRIHERFEVVFGNRVEKYCEIITKDISAYKPHNVPVAKALEMLDFPDCILALDSMAAPNCFSRKAYSSTSHTLH
jgi:hypothetical protein